MLANGLFNLLVDRQQSLACAPVHLADKLAAESIDDAGDRRSFALANEVEVQHALDGTGLEAVDEASSLVVEESMLRERAQRSAGGSEALDLIIGGQAFGTIGTVGGRLSHGWSVNFEKLATAERFQSNEVIPLATGFTGQQLAWLVEAQLRKPGERFSDDKWDERENMEGESTVRGSRVPPKAIEGDNGLVEKDLSDGWEKIRFGREQQLNGEVRRV